MKEGIKTEQHFLNISMQLLLNTYKGYLYHLFLEGRQIPDTPPQTMLLGRRNGGCEDKKSIIGLLTHRLNLFSLTPTSKNS